MCEIFLFFLGKDFVLFSPCLNFDLCAGGTNFSLSSLKQNSVYGICSVSFSDHPPSHRLRMPSLHNEGSSPVESAVEHIFYKLQGKGNKECLCLTEKRGTEMFLRADKTSSCRITRTRMDSL